MGLGDNLMATGMARGFHVRGKRAAFGDGQKIIWDHHSEQIFRGNRNIAPPGSEGANDLEWIPFYRGHRIYNRQVGRRWEWNMDFRPVPGEVFLTDDELEFGAKAGSGYVVIEPNVQSWKDCARNKQWPAPNYGKISRYLAKDGYEVVQMVPRHARYLLDTAWVRLLKAPTFRHALAVLKNAALYIGPEGGLHHGAAAVGTPAVVIFGGWIPPQVTGYDTHTNMTGKAGMFCGLLHNCMHCRAAMASISVDSVHRAAERYLKPDALPEFDLHRLRPEGDGGVRGGPAISQGQP